MATVEYAFLCRAIGIDPETGRTSFLTIIDSLQPSAYPVQIAGFVVVIHLLGEPAEKVPLTVALIRLEDEKVLVTVQLTAWVGDHARTVYGVPNGVRMHVRFPALSVAMPGEYAVLITSNGKELKRLPLLLLTPHASRNN
jgi:hypothetical protein